MSAEVGGILWIVIDIVFVLALAGALVYGIYQWRHRPRDSATREVSDEAVRKEYHSEQ
jgi:hypothetical protein